MKCIEMTSLSVAIDCDNRFPIVVDFGVPFAAGSRELLLALIFSKCNASIIVYFLQLASFVFRHPCA